ncbi:MAG: hypothetical protein ABEJ58_04095 [Halodesulfurarchaeum sp.]
MTETVSLSDLAIAAYCPRKLYYARQGRRRPPPEYDRARSLAARYSDVLENPQDLEERSLGTDLATVRRNLERTKSTCDAWSALVDPAETDVVLEGRAVRGRVAKVLEEPLSPTLVSPGEPPENGVWHPQGIRAVGAAKALAWERENRVDRAFVEYARYGVIREVSIGTRLKAAYRRTLRTVQGLSGPPPRLGSGAKCEACEFADQCGVKTRSLRSFR